MAAWFAGRVEPGEERSDTFRRAQKAQRAEQWSGEFALANPATITTNEAAGGGKPQYHPRLLRALLIHSYANGIFSSRRIERVTHRDIGVRFVAANLHPDHDTIAVFRRTNKAAFLQVLLLTADIAALTAQAAASLCGEESRRRGARHAAGPAPADRRRWRRAWRQPACSENLIPKVSAQCPIPTGFAGQFSSPKWPSSGALGCPTGIICFPSPRPTQPQTAVSPQMTDLARKLRRTGPGLLACLSNPDVSFVPAGQSSVCAGGAICSARYHGTSTSPSHPPGMSACSKRERMAAS